MCSEIEKNLKRTGRSSTIVRGVIGSSDAVRKLDTGVLRKSCVTSAIPPKKAIVSRLMWLPENLDGRDTPGQCSRWRVPGLSLPEPLKDRLFLFLRRDV